MEREAPTATPATKSTTPAGQQGADQVPEQVRVRIDKVARMRARGIEPYPVGFDRSSTLAEVRAAHPDLPPDTSTGVQVSVAGRVVLKRDGGRLCFATLRDGTADLQVMLPLDGVGAEALQSWKADVDLGDQVGVVGEVVTSRRGELSVRATSFAMTAKSLRPLPEKFHGLSDPEARVRMRYVDLIVRPEARTMLHLRSAVVRALRETMHAEGYLEVETPMLQVMHGGANARPFVTHINAYDMPLYLRIAPELYLKRLLVGGVERVFEVNRNFRNEGADSSHNPEFTMLEAYQAYGDYDTMRLLTQRLVQAAATAAFGEPVARRAQADGSVEEFDLSGDWPVRTVAEAVSEALGEEISLDTEIAVLRRHAEAAGLQEPPDASVGMLIEELYVEHVERHTTTPVFYRDFPKENAPLTRVHRGDERLTEKWDLVCWGSEQGTGYSELIDPLDQRERLLAQAARSDRGDEEAMRLDEDFLRALEHGMPPAGGMGLGVDRLVMNLTGLGIRDTILFPLVKPGG